MIRKVDSKGRVLLGADWAGKYVVVHDNAGRLDIYELQTGAIVPDAAGRDSAIDRLIDTMIYGKESEDKE